MITYDYDTTPREVIAQHLPHKYDMSLNRDDMVAVLEALSLFGENADLGLDEAVDRAASLRIAILETIGIEEI